MRKQNVQNKWHQVRTTNVKCLYVLLWCEFCKIGDHHDTRKYISKSECVFFFSSLANKLNHKIECTRISICFYLGALMVFDVFFFSFESYSGHYLLFYISLDSCVWECGCFSLVSDKINGFLRKIDGFRVSCVFVLVLPFATASIHICRHCALFRRRNQMVHCNA